MIPTPQTIGGFGGNCFQACIASIMELPIDAVPHFFREARPGKDCWTLKQWREVMRFADSRNHQACWLDPDLEADKPWIKRLKESGLFYVAFGMSPRGPFGHCVVMRGSGFVYDPAGDMFINGDPFLYVLLEPKRGHKHDD